MYDSAQSVDDVTSNVIVSVAKDMPKQDVALRAARKAAPPSLNIGVATILLVVKRV